MKADRLRRRIDEDNHPEDAYCVCYVAVENAQTEVDAYFGSTLEESGRHVSKLEIDHSRSTGYRAQPGNIVSTFITDKVIRMKTWPRNHVATK